MAVMLQESDDEPRPVSTARAPSARARSATCTPNAAGGVEVVSGAIWITQDGDRRDIVLARGEAFDFDRDGDALLSAFDDSRYLVLDGRRTARH